MKLTTNIMVSVLILFFVAGCASGPSYEEHSSTIEPPLPLDGRIYIYRTADFGPADQPIVMVNGEKVGKAIPNGFLYVDRLAGSYEVSTATEGEGKLSLTLDDGEVKYVRLDVKGGLFGGHIEFILVDKTVGERDLKSMNYTGASG